MNIGAIFPQIEAPSDPGAVREYTQAVEQMGYDHLAIYDHVLGADTASRPEWKGPYTSKDPFHEPFVVFGFMAGVSSRLEFVTEVIILPQRQTALVAKQAAEVDVLTGGRLRLGVGLGWNAVEFEALNEDFHTRGARLEEQIAVMKALWTSPVITYEGRWHHIVEAGINPLPVQRPIPLWMGGGRDSEVALRRIARLGDGWFPQVPPDAQAAAAIANLRRYAQEAGRDPSAIGIEGRINALDGPPDVMVERAKAWERLGATHLAVNTMRNGHKSITEHIASLRAFIDAWRR
ncbi:MAG: LLM class F420-dependent oxidoreductase [Chloroflexota bacterium]